MSQPSLVQIKNASKEYKLKKQHIFALNNVSLEIKTGQKIAIMGPSGSGKSTLMHLMGGLDRPTTGEIIVANQVLSQLNDQAISAFRNHQVGFIFQDFNLINYLSVLDNTALPLRILGHSASHAQKKARQLLEQLDLADLARRLPSQISGGQKQRVAVARALISEPSLILADEPTANLDEKNAQNVLDLIHQIDLSQNRAVVIVTHNSHIAQQFDKTIHLNQGQILDPSSI